MKCKYCKKMDRRLKVSNMHTKCFIKHINSPKVRDRMTKIFAKPLRHSMDYMGIARKTILEVKEKKK